MGTSFPLPTSVAGNASTSDHSGRQLINWRPLCNGTLTTATPFPLKLLETWGWKSERSMQISFSGELAHSMAVMLLELNAELEEFAYQQDHVSEHAEQLSTNLLGSSAQA